MPIDGPEERPMAGDWRDRAECRGYDPALWFPKSLERGTRHIPGLAEQICSECPVQVECLDAAIRSKSTEGIWAGTTPRGRR